MRGGLLAVRLELRSFVCSAQSIKFQSELERGRGNYNPSGKIGCNHSSKKISVADRAIQCGTRRAVTGDIHIRICEGVPFYLAIFLWAASVKAYFYRLGKL